MKSIRTGRWKFILAPKPELYDLARDPLEKDNVIDREAETAGRLLRRLKELEKSLSSPAAGEPRFALSQGDAEKLSSLGYVGLGPEPRIPRHSDTDPKDRIRVFEDMVKAEAALAGGAPEEAAEILRRVVAEDPGNPSLLHFLGRAYQKLGDLDASIEALSRPSASVRTMSIPTICWPGAISGRGCPGRRRARPSSSYPPSPIIWAR